MLESGRNDLMFPYASVNIQWVCRFYGNLIMVWLIGSQLIRTPDID